MTKLIKLGVVAALGAATLTVSPAASHAALPPGAVWRPESISMLLGGGSTLTVLWDRLNDPGVVAYHIGDVPGTGSIDCSIANDPSATARLDYSPTQTGLSKTAVMPLTVGSDPINGRTTTWAIPVTVDPGYYWFQLIVNGADVPACAFPLTTIPFTTTLPYPVTITADRIHDAASYWYRAPITVVGSSGNPTAVCGSKTYSGPDTAGTFLQVTCSDRPWHNVATSASWVFGYDATPPVITFENNITDGATYPVGSVPPFPACFASDALSGAGACTSSGYSTAVGPHTITGTSTDVAGNTGTATISYTVGNPVPTTPELSITGAAEFEGTKRDGKIVFTIRLSTAAATKVTVKAKSQGLTASSNDFDRLDKTVTFAPGETVKTVTVEIERDKKREADETLSVTLSRATGGATISPTAGSAIGTIINDD